MDAEQYVSAMCVNYNDVETVYASNVKDSVFLSLAELTNTLIHSRGKLVPVGKVVGIEYVPISGPNNGNFIKKLRRNSQEKIISVDAAKDILLSQIGNKVIGPVTLKNHKDFEVDSQHNIYSMTKWLNRAKPEDGRYAVQSIGGSGFSSGINELGSVIGDEE